MGKQIQIIWERLNQTKLSGWARLWIVVLAPFWVFGIVIEYNNNSYRPYDNQTLSFLQHVKALLEAVVGVSFGVLCFFLVAMAAKWAAIWVWRGFKQAKPTDTDTQ